VPLPGAWPDREPVGEKDTTYLVVTHQGASVDTLKNDKDILTNDKELW
jgi:hypothetical protein